MFIPIPEHRLSIVAAWLSGFFTAEVANIIGFESAHFVDSTGYRLNMVGKEGDYNTREISFGTLDKLKMRIQIPNGKLGHHFNQLCEFLARRNSKEYRSLLIVRHGGGKSVVRAFCGKVDTKRTCAELYDALGLPIIRGPVESQPV